MQRGSEVTNEISLAKLPCACANLRRAARAVTQLYAQEVRRAGLVGTQFTLLSVLMGAGEITQGRLGQTMAIDSTTLTRTLAPLRRRGWVEFAPATDRRQKRLRLTAGGRMKFRETAQHWQRAQERLRRALGERDFKLLLELLPRVTQAALKA